MGKYLINVGKRIFKDIKDYGLAALMYLIYYIMAVTFFKASCPLVLLTGFPCPGCGILRCLKLILIFRFQDAWLINPVSFAWMFLFIWVIITRYFIGKNFKLTKVFFWIVFALTIGKYIHGMVKYFPNHIPYVYRKNNPLYRVYQLFLATR